MARTLVLTVVYLTVAWVLMVSYQIFTGPALTTLAASLAGPAPLLASWIVSGMGLAVFVFSFAWMFTFSAIISSLMFGKERRITIQFLVSLGLTLVGSLLLGAISEAGLNLSTESLLSSPVTGLFGNAAFAVFYLVLPFAVMLAIDIRQMRK